MARPVRAAARRARELFHAGYGYSSIEENENAQNPSEDSDSDLSVFLSDSEQVESFENDDDNVAHGGGGDGPSRGNVQQRDIFGYDDEDVIPKPAKFKPARPVGPHIWERITRDGIQNFTRAIDIFSLFFTSEVLEMLCYHTNTYGWMHAQEKPSYVNADGSWPEVGVLEMQHFLALIIFMGFVKRPDISRYWSTATLYSGGWARRLMTRDRFKALHGMLHVSDPSIDSKEDKLGKVRELMNFMKKQCADLYQPTENISVDERMVKSKARCKIRQFMANKPIRFGFKLWCVCESSTGYTMDFNVYTGRQENASENGLAYDVVMNLVMRYQKQGYNIYMDNFYTSMHLLSDLRALGFNACGTCRTNRRGFPKELADKKWGSKAQRGDLRWMRKDGILCAQWKDSKPVTVCSTFHSANDVAEATRNIKDKTGSFKKMTIKRPEAHEDYTRYMGGVDRADHLLASYDIGKKTYRWWKALFFHILDLAVVNSFILFQAIRERYPRHPGLQRPNGYSQLSFREELVRQLAQISPDEPTPEFRPKPPCSRQYASDHLPDCTAKRRNCHLCYMENKSISRTNWKCTSATCDVYLCMTTTRNCFAKWHSKCGDNIRKLHT